MATIYSRKYGNFIGIDASSDASSVSPNRLAYARNVYRDYARDRGEAIETVVGYRLLNTVSQQKIHAIYSYRNYIIYHAGTRLWYVLKNQIDTPSAHRQVTGITLRQTKSYGIEFGDSLLVFDGAKYYKIIGNGGIINGDEITASAVAPIITLNGEEYQQRNMLTNAYVERYLKADIDEVIDNYGLKYSVSGQNATITGIEPKRSIVYIPDTITVNGEKKAIVGIAENAFNATQIKRVVADKRDGTLTVANGAFEGCADLATVVFNCKVSIASGAFYETSNIKVAWFGEKPTIASGAFSDSVDSVYYSGADDSDITNITYDEILTLCELHSVYANETVYTGISTSNYTAKVQAGYPNKVASIDSSMSTYAITTDGYSTLSVINFDNTFYCGIITKTLDGFVISEEEDLITAYRFPLSDGCLSVTQVKVDGSILPTSQYKIERRGTTPIAIVIEGAYDSLANKDIRIKCTGSESGAQSQYFSDFRRFTGYTGTSLDAIRKCTVATVFDNRLFLTGNPDIPNIVFFSSINADGENDPSYFGVLSYISTGIGSIANNAMLSSPSYLAVFKEGHGSVYCLSPIDTTSSILPRTYAVTEGIAGIGCKGATANFYDDMVFLSERGLEALSSKNVQLERNIIHRSHLIDRLLESADLDNAQMCVWSGYLVVACKDKFFLADSRILTKDGYEWFYFDGIGSWQGDHERFHNLSVMPEELKGKGYAIDGNEDYCEYSRVNTEAAFDTTVYYKLINGVKYLVDSDGEREGGTFNPSSAVWSDGNLLIFGTESGALCCFNNDHRGEIIVGEEREDEISRIYYSRLGHRYTAEFSLCNDTCGYSDLDKDTVNRSLSLKVRAVPSDMSFHLKVRTNRKSWEDIELFAGSDTSLYSVDFGAATFEVSDNDLYILGHEHLRKWVEKQYHIYSDEYLKPFAIKFIQYRFRFNGRIREREV